MNWVLFLVLGSPVVWLFVQHRRGKLIPQDHATTVYFVFSIIYGTSCVFHSSRNFANTIPYDVGYYRIMPIFVGPNWHDGPLFFGKILPVVSFFYPFWLYFPLGFIPSTRPRLRLWLQAIFYAIHSLVSGWDLVPLEIYN